MRHARKGYKLGRTSAHRKATLAALAGALIRHKRIRTTLTKAKAARSFVEPLITRARVDSTHNRREVFSQLRDKYAVTSLFNEVAARVGDRPGGYTRIVKLGQRSGDGAEMAIIELVDFNESVPMESSSRRRRTRRSTRRRRSEVPRARAAEETVVESRADAEEPVNSASEADAAEPQETGVAEPSESAEDEQSEAISEALPDEPAAPDGAEESASAALAESEADAPGADTAAEPEAQRTRRNAQDDPPPAEATD